MRSFFCIFCNNIFESRQQIYEHLSRIPYHDQIPEDADDTGKSTSNGHKSKSKPSQPTDCYSKLDLSVGKNSNDDSNKSELDDYEEDYEECEREFAEWIERFLLFQDSLQNYCKPINPVNRTLLKGCPVCDRIIACYQQQEPELIDNSSINKLTAYTNGSSLKAKAKVFEHLRYYPYKCSSCCQKNRNKQFSNNEDFKKHNIRMHFKEQNVLRKVKLRKLEKFVEFSLKPSFIDIEDTDIYERYSKL